MTRHGPRRRVKPRSDDAEGLIFHPKEMGWVFFQTFIFNLNLFWDQRVDTETSILSEQCILSLNHGKDIV